MRSLLRILLFCYGFNCVKMIASNITIFADRTLGEIIKLKLGYNSSVWSIKTSFLTRKRCQALSCWLALPSLSLTLSHLQSFPLPPFFPSTYSQSRIHARLQIRDLLSYVKWRSLPETNPKHKTILDSQSLELLEK